MRAEAEIIARAIRWATVYYVERPYGDAERAADKANMLAGPEPEMPPRPVFPPRPNHG